MQTLATILSLAEFESKCLFYESARRGRANDVSHIEFRLRTWWSDCFAPRHPQSVCFLMTIPKKPLNLLCLDFLGVAESGDESISEDESRLETAHLAEVRVPPAPSVSTDTEKEAASVSANEAAPLPTATSSSPMEPAPAAEPAINGAQSDPSASYIISYCWPTRCIPCSTTALLAVSAMLLIIYLKFSSPCFSDCKRSCQEVLKPGTGLEVKLFGGGLTDVVAVIARTISSSIGCDSLRVHHLL